MVGLSSLQKVRLSYSPKVPDALKRLTELDFTSHQITTQVSQEIRSRFPHLAHNTSLTITRLDVPKPTHPLKIGIVLSGGQAPGGHNVIAGVFDAIHEFNTSSQLIGFLNGPSGIVKNQYKEISQELIDQYRNQGGFDIIGSGRTKIETEEQFSASLKTVELHKLDGLIIVGGDDSNTNAALLAEYLLRHGSKTCVIGVPKTIDGDLQNQNIEISFGFDSAAKTYSEIIGNICRDAISAKKYYYFIKLMGRSASHITLECALATAPNLAFIAEELKAKSMTLSEVIQQVVDLVVERAKAGKDYGIILIPEGIIEFLQDIKELIRELNSLLASNGSHVAMIEKMHSNAEKIAYVIDHLQPSSKNSFVSLSEDIQAQLLLDRDPHGNVQVSKIETERLFISLVAKELRLRAQKGEYSGKFSGQPIFCGYEGRSCLPSNFDANYCYALGIEAALLIARGYSGYIAALQGLHLDASKWIPAPCSIVSMLHLEERDGISKPVIEKALVQLAGKPFTHFVAQRASWRLQDIYTQPGPIQFFGPEDITDRPVITIALGK